MLKFAEPGSRPRRLAIRTRVGPSKPKTTLSPLPGFSGFSFFLEILIRSPRTSFSAARKSVISSRPFSSRKSAYSSQSLADHLSLGNSMRRLYLPPVALSKPTPGNRGGQNSQKGSPNHPRHLSKREPGAKPNETSRVPSRP